MQQEITVQVVMLPKQNPKNCIGLIKCIKEWRSFISPEEDFSLVGDVHWGRNVSQGVFEYWEPQHLYFISDEEPKAEQWVFCMDVHLNNPNHSPDKYINPVRKRGAGDNCNACKPIIASTNRSLGLPAIPLIWIRDIYVPSNGSIKEVKLKSVYDKTICKDVPTVNTLSHSDYCKGNHENIYKLKLTLNNEVVIIDQLFEKQKDSFIKAATSMTGSATLTPEFKALEEKFDKTISEPSLGLFEESYLETLFPKEQCGDLSLDEPKCYTREEFEYQLKNVVPKEERQKWATENLSKVVDNTDLEEYEIKQAAKKYSIEAEGRYLGTPYEQRRYAFEAAVNWYKEKAGNDAIEFMRWTRSQSCGYVIGGDNRNRKLNTTSFITDQELYELWKQSKQNKQQ